MWRCTSRGNNKGWRSSTWRGAGVKEQRATRRSRRKLSRWLSHLPEDTWRTFISLFWCIDKMCELHHTGPMRGSYVWLKFLLFLKKNVVETLSLKSALCFHHHQWRKHAVHGTICTHTVFGLELLSVHISDCMRLQCVLAAAEEVTTKLPQSFSRAGFWRVGKAEWVMRMNETGKCVPQLKKNMRLGFN